MILAGRLLIAALAIVCVAWCLHDGRPSLGLLWGALCIGFGIGMLTTIAAYSLSGSSES